MKLQRLSLFLLLSFLVLPSAFARKPAVEDFVGVEPQDYSRTPQGTEVLFDFGNKIKANPTTTENSNLTSTFVLISFILLPFAMWFGITRSSLSHTEEEEHMAEVKNIKDYQKAETEEENKKAS
tara:strand:- start:63874 stop:64245 length:372 start_codon:yes stop_codon:yes gene_type:complete